MRRPWPTRACGVIKKTSGILAYTASIEGWIINRNRFSMKQSWPIRHTKAAFVFFFFFFVLLLLLLLLKYRSFVEKKTSAFQQMNIFHFYTYLTELQATMWMQSNESLFNIFVETITEAYLRTPCDPCLKNRVAHEWPRI